ncbi:MAG: hypothetical protein ACFBZ9_03520 [Sphingomonadales bacterium]
MRVYTAEGTGPQTLPDDALLRRYGIDGHYTDCFSRDVQKALTLADFITAFYKSGPFIAERFVLSQAANETITNTDVDALARGEIEKFGLRDVEERSDDQILLKDRIGQTCSWLKVVRRRAGTQLYFGSAVIADSGVLPLRLRLLIGPILAYSRIVLTAASKTLAFERLR